MPVSRSSKRQIRPQQNFDASVPHQQNDNEAAPVLKDKLAHQKFRLTRLKDKSICTSRFTLVCSPAERELPCCEGGG